MFLRYWNNDAATAAKFRGDWLVSGDLGTRDEAGYFRFVGRDDDLITSGGYRIGPGEIEACLQRHPAVALAAAVGEPDPIRTEVVKAVVVLKAGHQASPALAAELQGVHGSVVVLAGERLAAVPGALGLAWNITAAVDGKFGWIPRKAGARGAAWAGLHPAHLPGGRSAARMRAVAPVGGSDDRLARRRAAPRCPRSQRVPSGQRGLCGQGRRDAASRAAANATRAVAKRNAQVALAAPRVRRGVRVRC